jgi:hypothetical protein
LKGCSAPSKQTNTYSSARPTANAKSRRRSVKRRRALTKSCKREVFIYDGLDLVGTVRIAADGKLTAYDPRGRRLGLFPTFQAASAAFDKPSARGAAG